MMIMLCCDGCTTQLAMHQNTALGALHCADVPCSLPVIVGSVLVMKFGYYAFAFQHPTTLCIKLLWRSCYRAGGAQAGTV